jgi:integrase
MSNEMPKPKLSFLHRFRTRHGKSVYYVKLSKSQKGRGTRIRDPVYRSEKFMEEYHAALRGAPITVAPLVGKDGKGSLGWLIKQYRDSRDWREMLSAATRRQRDPIFKQLEDSAGDIPYTAIRRRNIEEGMMARTQNQARHFYDTMRALFKWAVGHDLHDRNPTDGIKVKKDNGDGHLAWSIELIEQYEQRWPLGTKQRLAFDIYLYLGFRTGDAARFGKQHIRNGIAHLMTEKSQGKMPIYVPIHPALAASMAACPSPGLAIISKANGMPYAKEALGHFFHKAVKAAGIPVSERGKVKGYSAHGMRKASATIAAESGATEAELNAMFGWSGHQMAQLYTKKADRKRLAACAMQKWTRPSSDDVASQLPYLQMENER